MRGENKEEGRWMNKDLIPLKRVVFLVAYAK